MKNFSFFILLFSFLFAACSKEEVATQQGDLPTTFQVEAPATRATVSDLTRYIVEAYEGKDLGATPVRAETNNGSMTVILKKNTDYTLLFWADKGTAATEGVASSGYWNTDDLKVVAVSAGNESAAGEAAYCHKLEINSKELTPNYAIQLKNATAQVNFIESVGLETADNTLKVTYAAGSTLNVGTGKVTEATGVMTHTFTGIAEAAEDDIIATDYVLAPLDDKSLLNIEMQFNSEAKKALTNVPFQQNYKTNIKGEFSNFYTSTFTVSNEVADYENKPDVVIGAAKVGDFYMEDGTWSSTYTNNTQNPCIGIVYVVNPDGKTGKVVGLTEGTSLKWSTETVATGATNETDGRANMATIAAFITDQSKSWDAYPAFKWVADQNDKDTGGWADTDKWYLPAKEEVLALYAAWNGDATTNANDDARTAFNTQLTNGGGTELSASTYYWSSSEYTSNNSWYVNFYNGITYNYYKTTNNRVRCVRKF